MEEKEERIIRKISIATFTAIFLIGLGIIIFLLVAVVPIFIQMCAEIGVFCLLPLSTRIIMGISDALRNYWYFTLLPIFGILILAIRPIRKVLFKLSTRTLVLLIPICIIFAGLLIAFILLVVCLPVIRMFTIP